MSDLISREAVIKAMENNSFMVEAFGTKRKMIDSMMMCVEIANLPTVEAKEVVHGEWMLTAEKEPNYHWSVKAQCSNCSYEKGEIWGGNFPDVPAYLALELSLSYAKEVKMSNFCPDCGADMRKKV